MRHSYCSDNPVRSNMKQQSGHPRRQTLARRSVVATGLAASLSVAVGQRAQAATRAGAPLSVVDAGAVGDGVTDDTAAVRAAVSQAIAEGRTLVFPAGTY